MSFDALVTERADENLAAQTDPVTMASRLRACRDAIGHLADIFEDARIDKVVIVGNDQMEVFAPSNQPAFLVCLATDIQNLPFTPSQKAQLGPGVAEAEWGHHGPAAESYPGLPDLGEHVVRHLLANGFDPSTATTLPEIEGSRSSGAPHAFGFVYRQIFRGRPIPNLPLFLNTFYPPNQPPMARCIAFGRAVAAAVASWPSDERVAIIGSGGLSHFVIDEALDRRFIEDVRAGDLGALASIPEEALQAGNSEMKSWAATAAAMAQAGLALERCEYIPCYRSLAGTGNAMGFATWR